MICPAANAGAARDRFSSNYSAFGDVLPVSCNGLIKQPCPQWPVAAFNRIVFHDHDNVDAMGALVECEQLAGNMRRWMTKKAGR